VDECKPLGRGGSGRPARVIRGYVVSELLGRGAFGSVYRVHKERSAETVCAMKELDPTEHSDTFGKTPEVGGVYREQALDRRSIDEASPRV